MGYHLREGFRSIFTHGLMSFAAVCMILACLIIMGSFSLVAINIDNTLGRYEAENEFIAYIDETLAEDEARALQSKLEAIPNVSSVTFMTAGEALERYTERYTDSETRELFDGMDDSVLRHRYRIHVDDLEQMGETVRQVEAVSGVAKVQWEQAISDGRDPGGDPVGGEPVYYRQHHQAGHLQPAGGDRHHEDVRRHQRLYPLALYL